METQVTTTFKDLDLSQEIVEILDGLGFTNPTEIQKKAIPLLLSAPKIDFHGQAQTGTGKTLAFSIPVLSRIDKTSKDTQALIVAPTRELAGQIFDAIERFSKKMGISVVVIYGGVPIDQQMSKMRRGAQIVVGTPGRIIDHLNRKSISLKNLKTLVMDEADIMLDMGFKDEIDQILTFSPKSREIWLFSATVKGGIADIKRSHMTEPVSVQVSQKQVGNQQTKQYYCVVPFRSRAHAIMRFIQSVQEFYGIIFCQTKILASDLADQLTKRGYNVGALHGDMSQAHRNMVIKKFKQKEFTILVATDVAARGIDVENLSHVINFSVPEDVESYVHRVGRTGRAGKEGTAITFITKSELRTIQHIERKFSIAIMPIDVPSRDVVINNAIGEASKYISELVSKEKERDYSSLTPLMKTIDEEQLKLIVKDMLYNKFIATLDLQEIPTVRIDTAETSDLQELCINVGIDDDVTREEVIDYLMDTNILKDDQIKKIRIIKKLTYVKLAADCSPNLLNALRDKHLAGRKVRINMTCVVDDYGSRPRQGDSRSGGRGSRGSSGGGRGGYQGGGRGGDSRRRESSSYGGRDGGNRDRRR